MDGRQHVARVLPAPHQHDAFDAADAIVHTEDPGLGSSADRRPADIPQQDRDTILGFHRDVLDVRHRLNQADATDDHRLLTAAHQRAAGVAVVHLDRLRNLRDGQLVFLERERVDGDLILLDESPERDDLGDARDLRRTWRDDPVLELAQRHFVVSVAVDDVTVELTDPRRQRSQCRRDALRQGHVTKLLDDQLPREVIVGAVGECQLDDREPEDRAGPARDDVWHVVECPFDRHRDLLLDLLACVAGLDRDDDDVRIRDVGIGFDFELLKRPDPQSDEAKPEDQGQ